MKQNDTIYHQFEQRKLEYVMLVRKLNTYMCVEDMIEFIYKLSNIKHAMLRVPYEIIYKYEKYIFEKEKEI